jgi:hypothetical protein
MSFESGNNLRIIEFMTELRPDELIPRPDERISNDAEIGLLFLIIGISLIYELKRFGSIKRLRSKKTIQNETEIDRGNLEKVYETIIPEPDFMEESDVRELRTAKYYR